MTKDIRISNKRAWTTAAIGATAVFGLWLAYYTILRARYTTLEQRGLFGDSFGALNSLLTGLTLVAIVLTIRQTMESLEEMSRTRLQSADDAAKNARLAAFGNLISAIQTLMTYYENEITSRTSDIQSQNISSDEQTKFRAAILHGQRAKIENIAHLEEVRKRLVAEFGIELELPPEIKRICEQLFFQAVQISSTATVQSPDS